MPARVAIESQHLPRLASPYLFVASDYQLALQAGKKGPESAMTSSAAVEKTVRLQLAVEVCLAMGIGVRAASMLWCQRCQSKTYLGAEFCITPGCRLPPQYEQELQAGLFSRTRTRA